MLKKKCGMVAWWILNDFESSLQNLWGFLPSTVLISWGSYIIHSLFSFLKPPVRFPLTAVARRFISAAVARLFGTFFLLDQMEKLLPHACIQMWDHQSWHVEAFRTHSNFSKVFLYLAGKSWNNWAWLRTNHAISVCMGHSLSVS